MLLFLFELVAVEISDSVDRECSLVGGHAGQHQAVIYDQKVDGS